MPCALRGALLSAVWAGAAAGILLTLAWIYTPEWLVALVYVLLGWVGAIALAALIVTLGRRAGGGVLYTAGDTKRLRQARDASHRRPRLE